MAKLAEDDLLSGCDDKRPHRALRLIKAFIAIEDPEAEDALIIIAEKLAASEIKRHAPAKR